MEDDLKPMDEGDVTHTAADPHPVGHEAPAAAETEAPIDAETPKPAMPMTLENATQQIKDGAGHVTQQVGDKTMSFVGQGKDRAVDALEQLSKLIDDAAAQIDEKLGGSNGQFVRTAAGTVQGFADQLRDKKVDDLVDDTRALIRKSPGVAIAAAAAVGFVVARLASAGLDKRA